MSRQEKQEFYNTQAWKNTRKAYASSVGGLCEQCLRAGIYSPGEIVHHKTHLTPENLNDPTIALDWSNLELLCRKCHANAHKYDNPNLRYVIDESGRVTVK